MDKAIKAHLFIIIILIYPYLRNRDNRKGLIWSDYRTHCSKVKLFVTIDTIYQIRQNLSKTSIKKKNNASINLFIFYYVFIILPK